MGQKADSSSRGRHLLEPVAPPQTSSQADSSPRVKERKGVLPVVKSVAWITVLAALCGGMAAGFTINYLLVNNTLDNNGRWESTKQKLELFVMGAMSYTREPQALAGFDMNLGAWQGFQEMLWRNKVHIQQLDFDFLLPSEAYLCFIINKGRDQFSGIRISTSHLYKPAYFTARNDGEFMKTTDIATPSLAPFAWHHFTLRNGSSAPSIEINGVPIKVPELVAPMPAKVGFRGCWEQVRVRNFHVDQGAMMPVNETFFFIGNWKPVFRFALVGAVFTMAGLFTGLKLANVNPTQSAWSMFAFSLFAIALAILLACILHYRYLRLYPRGHSLARAERAYVENLLALRIDEIKSACPEMPPPDTSRILFIGSSQTYGSGATRADDAFVRLVENKLNSMGSATKYECINAAVVGFTAQSLADAYEREWIKFAPEVLVVNLSNNDRLEAPFRAGLERFIALNKRHNIKTVFVLEANAIEVTPHDLPMHLVMREVAERNQVPVIDLHGYLKENHDKGFLFWDFVHLTSFGHRLAANCIFDHLRAIGTVKRSAPRPPAPGFSSEKLQREAARP